MRGRKRRNDIPSSEAENVVSLYKNKISLKQIAFDYDVTAYVVRGLLVDMGVKIARRGRRRIKLDVHNKPFIERLHSQYEKELASVIQGAKIARRGRRKNEFAPYKDKDGISHSYVDAGPMLNAVRKKNEMYDLNLFRKPLGEENVER